MTETYTDFDLWCPGVLVVDDSPRVRSILAQRFRSRGFAVWRAEGGREAVELYRHHPGIDLVLIDVTMPGMDGFDTLAALRRLDPMVRYCFLVDEEGDGWRAEALMDHGAELLLSKPLGLADIDRIVSELVRPAEAETGEWVAAG